MEQASKEARPRRGLVRPGPAESGPKQEAVVEDPDFGRLSVLDVWSGVVTSFAWHAGQIALTAKLLPDTPVTTMQFRYSSGEWGRADG